MTAPAVERRREPERGKKRNDALLSMHPFPEKSGSRFPGDHGEKETPVPIPNTAVKLLSGDGTATLVVGE